MVAGIDQDSSSGRAVFERSAESLTIAANLGDQLDRLAMVLAVVDVADEIGDFRAAVQLDVSTAQPAR